MCSPTLSTEPFLFLRVGVWGACFDQGQPHPGAGEGPRLLREAGLLETLAQHGLDVEDHGDEVRERPQVDTQETRQVAVAQFSKVVRDKVVLHTFTILITAMRRKTFHFISNCSCSNENF